MITSLRFMVGVVGLLSFAALSSRRAEAMGMEGFGPAGEHISRSDDWPKGVEDVLRHPARVYWRDINGSENAFYDGDIHVVNELVELYSRVDLAKHPVLIYSGRPTARSLRGDKSAPYVVEFVVPGRFDGFGFKGRMSGGIDLLAPRMIIHLDEKLADHLGELKVPANITLRGRDSLSDKPDEQELRQRVDEYLNAHPQSARVPTPEKVLTAMQTADSEYEDGFTARGTRVEADPSGRDTFVGWTVTMGRERVVVEQRDVEDDTHPKLEGRCEYTIYAGPGRMGTIRGSRLWVDGKLIDSTPYATFEPVGPNYDLLIGRCMWPLGRGFTCRIDHINSVEQAGDGMLRVAAESYGDGLMRRWEMVVDPGNNYLVRSAKAFRENETEPSYAVETAGVLSGGGRSVAHTARWTEDGGPSESIAVSSVSSNADESLVQRTENRLDVLSGTGR